MRRMGGRIIDLVASQIWKYTLSVTRILLDQRPHESTSASDSRMVGIIESEARTRNLHSAKCFAHVGTKSVRIVMPSGMEKVRRDELNVSAVEPKMSIDLSL